LPHGGVELAIVAGELAQEVLHQGQDIALPFAQRRRAAAPGGDTVIQVGAEGAAPHLRFQVAVGGAHQPEAGRVPVVAADAAVLLFLDHAQQLRLQRQRQFTHLVEEQHTAIGRGKGAFARAIGAGESAAFVPEQFAARQFRRQGGAIDDRQFARAAVQAVDGLGQQVLAGAGFAGDQDGRLGEGRHFHQAAQHARPSRALPDEAGAHAVGSHEPVHFVPALQAGQHLGQDGFAGLPEQQVGCAGRQYFPHGAGWQFGGFATDGQHLLGAGRSPERGQPGVPAGEEKDAGAAIGRRLGNRHAGAAQVVPQPVAGTCRHIVCRQQAS
jgi:hypothetical protein